VPGHFTRSLALRRKCVNEASRLMEPDSVSPLSGTRKMFPMTNRGDVFMKTKEAESCPLPDRPVPCPGVVSSEESDVYARVRRTPEAGEATGVARTPPAREWRAGPGAEAATGRGCIRLREVEGAASGWFGESGSNTGNHGGCDAVSDSGPEVCTAAKKAP